MEDFTNTSGLVSVGDAVLRYVVEGSGQHVLVVGSSPKDLLAALP